MCCSPTPSPMCRSSSAATARSSSTRWTRSGSAATCRLSSIRHAKRPAISATAWKPARWNPSGSPRPTPRVRHDRRGGGRLRLSALRQAEARRHRAFVPAARPPPTRCARHFPNGVEGALFVLERLRARETPEELEKLRLASRPRHRFDARRFASHGMGSTKAEIAEALRHEETARRLTFDYCLIAADEPRPRSLGAALGKGRRALGRFQRRLPGCSATSRAWALPASLTGASELFGRGRIDPAGGAQADPRRRRRRRDLRGGGSRAARSKLPYMTSSGMGLVSHEAPRLRRCHQFYDDSDAKRPLDAGMVVSWKPRCSIRTTASSSSRTRSPLRRTAVRSMAIAPAGGTAPAAA